MLAGDKERLEDHLVHLLSRSASATAEHLMESLKERKLSYSIQAVYKELRKLQAEGIVIKARGLYSLRLSWIFNITDLADMAYATCIDAPFTEEMLPLSKKKVQWKFNNLIRADNFYLQVLTRLLVDPNVRFGFTVIDHPWFLFMQGKDEAKYTKIVEHQRKRHYILVEHDTPLGRAQLKFYDDGEESMSYAFSPGLGLSRHASCTAFIGEFILCEKLQRATKLVVDALYEKTHSSRNLDHGEILSLFTRTCSPTVVLERNEAKVRRWVRKFSEYFPEATAKARA